MTLPENSEQNTWKDQDSANLCTQKKKKKKRLKKELKSEIYTCSNIYKMIHKNSERYYIIINMSLLANVIKMIIKIDYVLPFLRRNIIQQQDVGWWLFYGQLTPKTSPVKFQ